MTARTAQETQERVARSLRRRYWAEKRFRAYGVLAVLFGIAFVVFLFANIISKGASVFRQTYVQLEIFYDPAVIDPAGARRKADLAAAAKTSPPRRREQFDRHPDAEIITSQPGLGSLTGARILAEIGDNRTRFTDARSLKAYAEARP